MIKYKSADLKIRAFERVSDRVKVQRSYIVVCDDRRLPSGFANSGANHISAVTETAALKYDVVFIQYV